MKKFDVYGLGNPLIDVLIKINDSVLQKLGLTKNSMSLVSTQKQNKILDLLADKPKELGVGGSCANTMVGIAQLGGTSAFSGKVGVDEFGEKYELELKKNQVNSLLKKKVGATGSSIILVSDDASRTMITHLGLCQNFMKDDIDLKTIEESKFLYATAYLWDTELQKGVIKTALDWAKKNGTLVSLSLSDPFCIDRHHEALNDLVTHHADLLFCNFEEASNLTRCKHQDQIIEKLQKQIDHFVITKDVEGAIISHNGHIYTIPSVSTIAEDTTGAGDSYAAAYLYGITNGYTPIEAGRLASKVASLVVSKIGPRYKGNLKDACKGYLKYSPES